MNSTAISTGSAAVTANSGATVGPGMTYSLRTATAGAVPRIQGAPKGSSHAQQPETKIESAVYAHIQAVRALGRTKINTVEIAKALGLSLGAVDKTLASLKQKGVRVI